MSESQRTNRPSERFVARSFAALFGLGGVAVLATLAFSHPADRQLAWLVVPALSALCLAGTLLISGGRGPQWAFYLLPPFGSILVATVSYGAAPDLRLAYATFLCWSITSAFYFFPRRVAVPNVPFAWLLYAIALLVGHQSFIAIGYFVPMVAVTVSAVLIDRLNVQREALAAELNRTLRTLEQQARTDPVTALPNRREFTRQLRREVARAQRSRVPLAVLMIDLDHFKQFNDSYGHPAGDELLREAARLWSGRLRAGDLLVRYGGDEFAAILPECPLEDAQQLADRLRAPLPLEQTCSIGVAAWLPDESGEQVVSRADEALLAGKRHGRDETYLWLGPEEPAVAGVAGVSTGG